MRSTHLTFRVLAIRCVASAALLAGCSGPATPTPQPPPLDPEPPAIICPAPQTVQSPTGGATPVVYGVATAINGRPPVTTVCEPASGSMFAIGHTMVQCTATDTLQRSASCTFAVTVTAPPMLTATSFLAFGDSITLGEDGVSLMAPARERVQPSFQLPSNQIYPGILQQSLVTRYQTQAPRVTNAGTRGEAARDASTLARFVGLASSQQYGVLLLMEGSNDLADEDARLIPPAIEGLRQILRAAKTRGIRPYLATIPPMNPAGFRGFAWNLVAGFNDQVRALAVSEGVTLVDVHQGYANDFSLLSADGLHPNAAGYGRMADLFFAAIKATLETPASASIGPAVRFDMRLPLRRSR